MIRDSFSRPAALKEATAYRKQNMPFQSVVSCNLSRYEHPTALRCPTPKSVYKRMGTVSDGRTAERCLHRRHGPHHRKMEKQSNSEIAAAEGPEMHVLLNESCSGARKPDFAHACVQHLHDQLFDVQSRLPNPETKLATTLGLTRVAGAINTHITHQRHTLLQVHIASSIGCPMRSMYCSLSCHTQLLKRLQAKSLSVGDTPECCNACSQESREHLPNRAEASRPAAGSWLTLPCRALLRVRA